MKLQSVVLSGVLLGVAVAGSIASAGAAQAEPDRWTVVVNSELAPGRFFEIHDHTDKEAAKAAALADCEQSFPAPINLGSASLNEPHCTVRLVFNSGYCAVLMRAEESSAASDIPNIVYSPGFGDDLQWAELDARIHNLDEYPLSSMPRTVWSGCQS